ncbi:MAG: prepilin-type N-terminal cleavage/methylation domain-containing protein [Planctomycetota bacterium]
MNSGQSLQKKRARRGFTLVEVLVAMGILVIGVTSILGLLVFGAALERTAERRSETALAAQQVVSELQNSFVMNPDGSVPEPPSLQFERTVPGHPKLTARVEIKKNPEAVGEYFAVIRIGWLERGELRFEEFRTILQREANFKNRVELEHARKVR